MDPVTELVLVSTMAVVAGLLAMTLLIGAAVAIWPDLFARLREKGDLRLSVRKATGFLDRPRYVDHLFYRYHRIYGGVVVVLAVVLLYFLAFVDTHAEWVRVLGIRNEIVADIVLTSARLVLWIGAIFAMLIGTIVLVRPSALKGFERWANRWLTPRRLTRGVAREYYPLERGVSRYPRTWGVAVALLSAVCLIALYVQWRMSGLGG